MKNWLSDIDDIPVAMITALGVVIAMNWLPYEWRQETMAVITGIFALARGRNGTNPKTEGTSGSV